MTWKGNYPGVDDLRPVPWGWASGRNGKRVRWIVVHVAAGYYEGTLSWFSDSRNGGNANAHYVVGLNGRIAQCVDEQYAAHHSYPVNQESVGIEHIDDLRNAQGPWMTDTQFGESTKLAAYLCEKYGLGPEAIMGHAQIGHTDHACPGPFFDLVAYRDHVSRLLSPSPAPSGPVLYRCIAGTFKARSGANRRVSELKGKGFEAALVREAGYFRVLAGSFRERTGADQRVKTLKAKGVEAYVLPTVKDIPVPKPKVPAPPASTRNWAPKTRRVAVEIERRFNVACSTYPGHGTTGEAYGIDAWVSPLGIRANKEQEATGDAIQKFVEANWARLGIDYIIWWGWINFGSGWKHYDPSSYRNPLAAKNPVTEAHLDHVHLQVRR